ncbi:hypothetical protein JXA12_00905 [Candidatus Woesearchaeota archaeon]|nr:hypothetical protein [Candidatus Woesearchaeota archaeon]
MLRVHIDTSEENPLVQAAEELLLAGLITPYEADDLLAQPWLSEEHA